MARFVPEKPLQWEYLFLYGQCVVLIIKILLCVGKQSEVLEEMFGFG